MGGLLRSTRAVTHRMHAQRAPLLRSVLAAFLLQGWQRAETALPTWASLRGMQDAAGRVDPRTTRRYDRARHNLDRHPTYALAGLVNTTPPPDVTT